MPILPVQAIAKMYAGALADKTGGEPTVRQFHLDFANAIHRKDPYHLKYLIDSMNDTGKRVFYQATNVKLPKTQKDSWQELLRWANISPKQDAEHEVAEKGAKASKVKVTIDGHVLNAKTFVDSLVNDHHCTSLIKEGTKYWLINPKTQDGANLSSKGVNLPEVIAYAKALSKLHAFSPSSTTL